MFDFRAAAVGCYRDDVEPHRQPVGPVARRIYLGCTTNPKLLAIVDRRLRTPRRHAAPRFYFHKHESVALKGYEIDLRSCSAKVARDDPKAGASQMALCQPLAVASELIMSGHAREKPAEPPRRVRYPASQR